MNNSNIDTIIFDAGGVLIYIEETRNTLIKRILLSSGYDAKIVELALEKAANFDESYFDENVEIVDWKDEKKWWFERTKIIANCVDEKTEELMDKLFHLGLDTFQYKLYDETIEILEELKNKYTLVIISNATATLDWCFDLLDMRKYFKEIIISSYEKCKKPEEEIFRITLDRINKNPEQCLFIDDKRKNTDTAKRLGMKVIHFDREKGENLKTILKRYRKKEKM